VKLAAHPEVAMVLPDELLQPDTDSSPAFIGLNPGPGGGPPTGATGKGVVIGVIDSGIWPEHPSFGDQGMPASPIPGLPCEFGNTAHNPLDAPFESMREGRPEKGRPSLVAQRSIPGGGTKSRPPSFSSEAQRKGSPSGPAW
jgi:subtilisin family serine protease